MRGQFSLFQSHLDLSHDYWKKLIGPGDLVIDATCGNGHDTLKLSALVESTGKVYAFDIQTKAIENTRLLLSNSSNVQFYQQCHSSFPDEILDESIKLVVYNLGYLPGSQKDKTSISTTTMASIEAAMPLLMKGGALSITCYPGHEEGKIEEEDLIHFCQQLSPKEWSCCHHRWLNRLNSPSLLLIQKARMD